MRLTSKSENKYGFITENNTLGIFPDNSYVGECYTKLGQLEDIEDELGIDLFTFFKVLQQGYIWVREHNTKEQEIVCERVRLNYLNRTLEFIVPRKEIGKGRNLYDHKRTWVLTKEELE